jgi:hypothetical protein
MDYRRQCLPELIGSNNSVKVALTARSGLTAILTSRPPTSSTVLLLSELLDVESIRARRPSQFFVCAVILSHVEHM